MELEKKRQLSRGLHPAARLRDWDLAVSKSELSGTLPDDLLSSRGTPQAPLPPAFQAVRRILTGPDPGSGLSRPGVAHMVLLAAQRADWEGRQPRSGDLLETALRLARSRPRRNSEDTDWVRPNSLSLDAALEALKRRPVVKLEPISSRDLAAWKRLRFLPHLRLQRRGWGQPRRSVVWELFYGRDPRQVERAAELTARQAGTSFLDTEATTAEIGALLGYPECCRTAYAKVPPSLQSRYFWHHVANRIALPKTAAWELNPAARAIDYVPCSLGCAEALRQARRFFSGRNAPYDPRNPFLFIRGAEGCWVELVPVSPPSRRFRYQAGARNGSGPDVDAVADGDEVDLDGETALILKKGRPLAPLSGRAFLWWHREVFQADLWRSLLDLVRTAPEPPAPAGDEPGQRRLKAAGVDARALNRLLASVDAECRAGGRMRCRSRYDGDVIRLRVDGREVRIFLVPRRAYKGPSFSESPSFFMCVREECPVTPQIDAQVRRYLEILARHDGRLKALYGG